MEPEIVPEPTAEEREAILTGLAGPGEEGHPGYRSAWRRAALDPDEPDEGHAYRA